jgi:hypothetical protein
MFNWINAFSNFGGNPSASIGGFPSVTNYSSLPAANAHTNEVYTVLNSEGGWIVSRKEAGLWKSDGASWTRLGNWVDAFKDTNLNLYNGADITKIARFDLSGIASLTNRLYALPDANGTIALTSDIPESWDLNDLEDTGTYVYGGSISLTSGNWRVKRVDVSGNITIANVLNNVFILTYNDAWTARATLTYT